MDRSIVFNLLTATSTQDELLQWTETLTKRQVYGQKTSVTANEFFSAGQNGHSPEFRLTMFGPDYQGEELLELDGVIYSIYRTYQGRNDTLELYAERRRGDEGNGSES